jgi:single-stranded DNA-binding protein
MQTASIIGNVGREVVVRFTSNGVPVASTGVAVHMGQDKPPIWWDCSVWGEEAQRFAEKVNKGDRIHLDGLLSFEIRKDSKAETLIMQPKLNIKSFHMVSRARTAEQSAPVESTPDNLDAAFASVSTDTPDDDTPF